MTFFSALNLLGRCLFLPKRLGVNCDDTTKIALSCKIYSMNKGLVQLIHFQVDWNGLEGIREDFEFHGI
jgi:hypothetical protein